MHNYRPRPGSFAEKAAQVLSPGIEMSSPALAEAIEGDVKQLAAYLETALDKGFFARRVEGGVGYYTTGPNFRPFAPAAAKEDDDTGHFVHRIVPAASAPPLAIVQQLRAVNRSKADAKPEVDRVPARASAASFIEEVERATAAVDSPAVQYGDFRVGIFSDGRMELRKCCQVMALSRAEIDTLVRFLESLPTTEGTGG